MVFFLFVSRWKRSERKAAIAIAWQTTMGKKENKSPPAQTRTERSLFFFQFHSFELEMPRPIQILKSTRGKGGTENPGEAGAATGTGNIIYAGFICKRLCGLLLR